MADDGVERGWGDTENSQTSASLDVGQESSPTGNSFRGRGRGRGSARETNGAYRGSNGDRDGRPSAAKGRGSNRESRSNAGRGHPSQTSPSLTKGSLQQGWAENTKPSSTDPSTHAVRTDVTVTATNPTSTQKETGWGDDAASAVRGERSQDVAPSNIARAQPAEIPKAEVGSSNKAKEPVDNLPKAKETGKGDDNRQEEGREVNGSGPIEVANNETPRTPTLDPNASVFEPKKQQPPQEDDLQAALPENDEQLQQARKPRKPHGEGYVNPDRVDTGGFRKAKLSPEDLAAKMAQARERNAELLKKKEVVDADEADWRDQEAESQKALEQERADRAAKAARLAEVQNSVNEARERNAARKMEKLQTRTWDSEKNLDDFDPAKGSAAVQRSDERPEDYDMSQHMWNGGRGRGRGRGRGARGRRTGAEAPAIARTPADLGDPNEFPAIFK